MYRFALAGLMLIALVACSATAVAQTGDPFVVNTNWTITDPETGAGIFDPGFGVDPDPGRAGYIPAYNDYDWMYTDDKPISASTLQSVLLSWETYCLPEIDGVDVLNRIQDLAVGQNRIQMVINHVVMDGQAPTKSMFTITFPPNFSIDNQNRYPLVICATGYGGKGLNETVFNGTPPDLFRVKSTYLFDKNDRGIVHVRWNAGGYRSLGINDEARYAVNELIQMLHLDYGCDKDRIITIGASRAGCASLILAQNTAHETYDYTVIGVFAKGFPLALGKISQIPVASYPALAGTYDINVGEGASKYDYDPPPGDNPALLVPAFGVPDFGVMMPEHADRLSPDHPENLQTLAGKYVMLAHTTHDIYFPFNHVIDMDNWLSANGVNHTTCLTLQGGHGSAAKTVVGEVFKDFLDYVVNDPDFVPADYQPPHLNHGLYEDARNYYIDTDLTEHGIGVQRLELNELPFTVTMPYRLGCDVFGGGTPGVANEPGILFLSGAAGNPWEVTVRRRQPDGSTGQPQSWSGTFDSSETAIIKWWPERTGWDDFPVQATGAGGVFDPDNDWLEWTAMCDGIDYSGYANWILSGQRLALETEIMSIQASPQQLYASAGLEGDAHTGYGVDAVPPQPWVDLTCTPAAGTAPVTFSCALTAGCYAPVDRTLAYSVDVTLPDDTLLPDHWQGTMTIGPDQALTHQQDFEYFDESHIGVIRYDVVVEDVTPAPLNQPPFPPSGRTGATKAIAVVNAPLSDPVRQFSWPLNSDPGWTTTGDWALGEPLGLGGQSGGPDPSVGHTGAKIFGYNLAGDYKNNMTGVHLTTAPFDCRDSSETRLKFWRWLGVEHPDHDRASVLVSAGGGSWITVWENGSEIADDQWQVVDLDISGVADDKTAVQVRWTMGPTDNTNTYCGWNIDDVEIWGRQSMAPTIIDDLTCIPAVGTLPMVTNIRFTMSNNCDSYRQVASRVDLDLAGGRHISNWKSGYQNIEPRGKTVTQWNQTIPALGMAVGDNIFTFNSLDVTPEPYNQPPHAPSGSHCDDTCTVTGVAP